MELIFQTDWETMKRPDRFLVLCVIIVEILGVCNCGVKENLMKTINL
jgi:hypothetical protein